jgi:hypothetical protein
MSMCVQCQSNFLLFVPAKLSSGRYANVCVPVPRCRECFGRIYAMKKMGIRVEYREKLWWSLVLVSSDIWKGF